MNSHATPRHATPRHATPRRYATVLLGFMLLSCEPVDQLDLSLRVNPLEPREAAFTENGGETVYLTKRTFGPNGELISSIVEGAINLDTWAAAARPRAAEAKRIGSFFNEGAWEVLDERGVTHRGYMIARQNYSEDAVPKIEEKRVSSKVTRWIQDGEESEVKPIVVRFAGFAEWDIPLMPPLDLLSGQEVELQIQRRANAIEERKSRLKTAAARVAQRANISDYIEVWVTGEIFALGTPAIAAQLQNLDEVVGIEIDESVSNNACSTSSLCSGTNPYLFSPFTEWRLGQGRRANRTNVDSFHSQGWTGERANPSRHSYGDIVISVIDAESYEDEFLGFNDGNIYNPMSRIASRFRCDIGSCVAAVHFPEGNEGDHGTMVASTAAANFQNNQAYNVGYNDPCYVGSWSHCPLWEEAASGYAPQASLQLIAYANTGLRQANAIARQIETGIDIANLSLSNHEICPRCKVHAWDSTQTAAENAFDDGILIVNAPHNEIPAPYACATPGSPESCTCDDPGQIAKEPFQWGDCTLDSPGNVPKVFTVNSLSGASCLSNYQSCGFYSGSRGGMDAKFPSGAVMPGVISGIDMIAPGNKTYLGTESDCPPEQDWGCLKYTSVGGTSIAAPAVSAAAALLKDGMLAGGHHFINSPGRLHTMMLAMADRTDGSGAAKTSGTDDLWGMGKLKMRRTSEISGGWGLWTKTFTPSSGNYVQRAFGSAPLPASATFMKCVFFEAEDVSQKDTVGDLYFAMSLGNPVGGTCPTTPSSGLIVGSDTSFDLKHMVAYSGALYNKCPYFTVHNGEVAGSSITTHTYCYYGNQNDSWPN